MYGKKKSSNQRAKERDGTRMKRKVSGKNDDAIAKQQNRLQLVRKENDERSPEQRKT